MAVLAVTERGNATRHIRRHAPEGCRPQGRLYCLNQEEVFSGNIDNESLGAHKAMHDLDFVARRL